jgi:hypothetical protein
MQDFTPSHSSATTSQQLRVGEFRDESLPIPGFLSGVLEIHYNTDKYATKATR